ncbi:helix-turn-helix domain-containing protein [Rhodococcus sp. O3]|uniref:helix-turn-helix domain-containing protein n=1 Tax=Rhodococcus sp. O3 TaxID=3404919 RepID=UPI003B67B412
MAVVYVQNLFRRDGGVRLAETGPAPAEGTAFTLVPNAALSLPETSSVSETDGGLHEPAPDARGGPHRLWREVVGEQIRQLRTDRAERLADVAERAGVSPQYLSEVERGVKDPSSEVLDAVAGALGTSVEGLARRAYRIVPAPQPNPEREFRLSAPVRLAA